MFDACGSISRSVRVALVLASGYEIVSAPSEAPCTRPAQVQAIMGETSSSPCMAIATVIGPFHIPLVGRFGTYSIFVISANFPATQNKFSCVDALYIFFLGGNFFFFSLDQPLCHLCLSQ